MRMRRALGMPVAVQCLQPQVVGTVEQLFVGELGQWSRWLDVGHGFGAAPATVPHALRGGSAGGAAGV